VEVKLYWPALAWAGLLLLISVQSWWAMFGLRSHHDWSFGAFAVVLLHTVVLYTLAVLVTACLFSSSIALLFTRLQ
jgi:hypothetical protein